MALSGSAFLALWNDVDPARVAEYDDWHTQEHVPERVGIAGFLSGRRYVAEERSADRYFTLYELATLAALDGPEYADVVGRPTPWSASMRPSLRKFERHPCATVFTAGDGVAGSVATFRFGVDASAAPIDADGARTALAGFLRAHGVTSIHLGRAVRDAAFPLRNAAGASRGSDVLRPESVLLVEGIARRGLDAAVPRIADALRARGAVGDILAATFDLAFAIRRDQLPHPTTQRQPPHPGRPA